MSAAFRFGVVAAPHGTGKDWIARAQRVADLGYSTLLTPDNLHLNAPLPALAAAAAAVDGLRVCPFVLAGPLRTPRATAWEAHSMTALTDGRFELGIGTGRPDAQAEAERLGMPWGTGAERLARLRETVAALRELDGDGPRTPVLMAGSGPKALAVAAREANTVMLAALPTTSRTQIRRMFRSVQDQAEGRPIEIGMNAFAVGDEIPPEMLRWMGPDAAEALGDPDSVVRLRGSTAEICSELQRRRDELGVSYVAVSEGFIEALAPVVERLTGG